MGFRYIIIRDPLLVGLHWKDENVLLNLKKNGQKHFFIIEKFYFEKKIVFFFGKRIDFQNFMKFQKYSDFFENFQIFKKKIRFFFSRLRKNKNLNRKSVSYKLQSIPKRFKNASFHCQELPGSHFPKVSIPTTFPKNCLLPRFGWQTSLHLDGVRFRQGVVLSFARRFMPRHSQKLWLGALET